MDNWKLEKTFTFEKKMPPFDYKGKIFSVCGSEWELTFKYIPFFEVHLQSFDLQQNVYVNTYAHNASIQCHRSYSYPIYFTNDNKLSHEFTPDKKSFGFRYNLDYPDCEQYLYKTSNPVLPDICIKLEFFSLKQYSSLQANIPEKPIEEVNVEKSFSDSSDGNFSDSSDGNFSDDIISNLKRLLFKGDFSDVTIRCGEQCFNVHKAILSARSPVLAAMLHSNMKERETGEINIEDVKPEVMQDLLLYIYTGKYKRNSIEITCGTLAASDKYMLTGLKHSCVELLRSSITTDNALDILILADLYDQELKKAAIKFVSLKYNIFLNSPQWQCLQKQNPALIIDIMAAKIEYLGGKSREGSNIVVKYI